jgi:cobalamin biosynthetic protein CobC
VVINPNNPTGELHQQHRLKTLLATVESLSGWLILDEAFMDVISVNQSLIHLTTNKHLFVLRSIRKFFGLAGN